MKMLVELQDSEELLAFEKWHEAYWKQRNLEKRIRVSIDLLNLSTRARTCLKAEGYETVESVMKASDRDLLSSPNLGWGTLKEIRENVNKFVTHEESTAWTKI